MNGTFSFLSRKIFLFGLFFLTIFISPSVSFAAQTACSWTKTSSGGWHDSAANWSCGAIPDNNTYDVTICNTSAAGAIVVNATTSITVGRLTVGNPGGAGTSCNSVGHTFSLIGGVTLTVNNDDGWGGGGDLRIGTRGVFNAGLGTNTIEGNMLHYGGTGATFTASSSTMYFPNAGSWITSTSSTLSFYDLSIAPAGGTTTIDTTTTLTLTVSNTLTTNGWGITYVNVEPTLTLSTTTTPLIVSGNRPYIEMATRLTGCGTSQTFGPAIIASTLLIGGTSGCAQATTTLSGNLDVFGDFTIQYYIGGSLDYITHEVVTNGYDLNVSSATFLGGGGVSMSPVLLRINKTSSFTTNGLSVVGAGANNEAFTVGGLKVDNGNAITFRGASVDLDDTDGTGLSLPFDVGTSTVTVNGNAGQTIDLASGHHFYNLVINNTGSDGDDSVSFYDDLDIDGNLTLIDGAIDLYAAPLFLLSTGNLNIGGNLTVNNSASTSIYRLAYGTTTFDGTSTFTDNLGNFNLGNVFVASSTAVASLTLASSATSTYMHVGSDETVSLGSNTLTLANTSATTTPLAILGTFNANTSTVTYAGSAHATITPTVYYNLNLNSPGKAGTISASTTVMNALTNTAGTLVITTDIPYLGGNITNNDTIRESGGILKKSATSLSADAGSYTTGTNMTITLVDQDGNLVGTTTDTATGVTVIISSGADSEAVTLTESGNATYTFTGTLPLSATNGSSNDGTLYVPSAGTITLAYVDPQDSADNAQSTTASVTIASSSGGGGGSTTYGGGGIVGSYGTVNTQPVSIIPTPPLIPPVTTDNPSGGISATLRAEITPVIAILLTGPIYANKTDTQNRILQFLLAGDPTIYPEGQITGYYGALTKKAIGRFQEKYNITKPGDEFYGYAGPNTRKKIIEVLGT